LEVRAGADPQVRVLLEQPANCGTVLEDLPASSVWGRFDLTSKLHIDMKNTQLLSRPEIDVLSGQNSLLVQHENQSWEVIQYQHADLQPDNSWILHRLLRGQSGTEPVMETPILAGASVVLLDGASLPAITHNYELGSEIKWNARFQGEIFEYDLAPVEISQLFQGIHFLPRAPVHLTAKTAGSDIHISWIRRTRSGGDNWSGLEVPMGESEELYSFEWFVDGAVALSETVSQPFRTIKASEILQVFPAGTPSFLDVAIAQISPEQGRGAVNRKMLTI
jgi:hypothetical protein